MYKTPLLFVTILATSGISAAAQHLAPSATSLTHDSVSSRDEITDRLGHHVLLNDDVNDRRRYFMIAADSSASVWRPAFSALSGTVLGAAIGFGIEWHGHPLPSCGDCGVNGNQRNAALRNGAVIGGLLGGATAWLLFGRN